MSTVEIVV